MAKALQPGDRAPNYSGSDSNTSADRRGAQTRDALLPKGNLYDPEVDYNGLTPEYGDNSAPQRDAPQGDLYRCGSPAPNRFLTAPFNVTNSPEGCETEVREIDMCVYGDGYDPHAPMRTRDVSDKWKVDTDEDGSIN